MAWFSREGKDWSQPIEIGDPDVWLWRVSWANGKAYGVGYDTSRAKPSFASIQAIVAVNSILLWSQPCSAKAAPMKPPSFSCPTRLASASCAVTVSQALGKTGHIQALPTSAPGEWKDLGVKIGGPNMVRLPDGRLLAAVRLYDKTVRTSLAWIDWRKEA